MLVYSKWRKQWFLDREEPFADRCEAVRAVAKAYNLEIKDVAYSVFDARQYKYDDIVAPVIVLDGAYYAAYEQRKTATGITVAVKKLEPKKAKRKSGRKKSTSS